VLASSYVEMQILREISSHAHLKTITKTAVRDPQQLLENERILSFFFILSDLQKKRRESSLLN
jgi:hypothetical protein